MKHTMKLQTNEQHYATSNKWSTYKRKQMKYTMQPQVNKAHYSPARNEHFMEMQTYETMQPQTIVELYATANK